MSARKKPKPGVMDGFDAWLARCRESDPQFDRRLADLSPKDYRRRVREYRRLFALLSSEFYRDAHRIALLARELAERMEAFAGRYPESPVRAILKAAGVAVDPREECEEVASWGPHTFDGLTENVCDFLGVVRHFHVLLRDVEDRPAVPDPEPAA